MNQSTYLLNNAFPQSLFHNMDVFYFQVHNYIINQSMSYVSLTLY